jgi:diguanylate cyclase (GGDEF)-like protein/PAS domain S-box-containing protein
VFISIIAELYHRARTKAANYAAELVLLDERKRAADELQESEEKYRNLFENANEAIMVVQDGKLVFFNLMATRLLGYSGEELASMPFVDFIHPDDRNKIYNIYLKQMTGEEMTPRHSYRTIRNDGNIRWVEGNVVLIKWKGKAATLNFLTDITERKQAEEKIQQMALHDPLTGLPNRKLFSDRLNIALARAHRNQNKVVVAMIDVDHFKTINDNFGHDVGDLFLKATAERLDAAMRKGDTVARFGGDEFLLILPDLEVIADAIQFAQKIVDSFCEPLRIDTHQLVVTISIGIAVYPNDGTDEGMLLKNADIAMYQAKRQGRARYQLYKAA